MFGIPIVVTIALFGALSNADIYSPTSRGQCSVEDMEKLAACGNHVLFNIEDCQPGDTICECCALQKMQKECFTMCAGHPENFLLRLIAECAGVKDACEENAERKKGNTGSKTSTLIPTSSKAAFDLPMSTPGAISSKPIGVGAAIAAGASHDNTGHKTAQENPTLTVASKLLREGEEGYVEENVASFIRHVNVSNASKNHSLNATGMFTPFLQLCSFRALIRNTNICSPAVLWNRQFDCHWPLAHYLGHSCCCGPCHALAGLIAELDRSSQ